jgi:arsenical pump membrane protein
VRILGWAIAAAAIACVAIAPAAALRAAARGTDVYLFLIGMMALAGYANATGIFAWLAAQAVRIAGPSRLRLFALVYAVGIGTTALLSNDATIIVLTPAVIGALRRYDAPPLPYVVACALVANAASFLLPISNPSNLLVFAGRMPPLVPWLHAFALPSLAAIAVTFAVARWLFRTDLGGAATAAGGAPVAPVEPLAVALLAAAAGVIVATSALGGPLGAATAACAAVTSVVAAVRDRGAAATIGRDIAWNIVALTAALFVLVSAVDRAGGFGATRALFARCEHLAAPWSSLAIGFLVAGASNLINNLPVGLTLGSTLPAMHASLRGAEAALVGVNLGPNACANGSLATLLWLTIVRRAGIAVPPFTFARAGVVTVIPALAAALALVAG